VTRLSLAAAPEAAFRPATLMGRLTRLCPAGRTSAAGLRQFKEAFAPRWERLYLIAPSFPAMALAGWEIRRAIMSPDSLPADALPAARPSREEIGFASHRTPWHRKRR
jgi:phosphatidylglycerol lysyltransferase